MLRGARLLHTVAVMAKKRKSPLPLQHRTGSLPLLHLFAGAAIIIIATGIAYFPAIRGEFIFDDFMNLTENRLVQSSDGPYKFWFTTEPVDYWPVFNTALWIEWRLWKTNPIGYHLSNLLLHVGAALLIWRILQRLSIPGAFLAALLFAVHPVNVESVAWITQLKNLLAMLFLLLSILLYLQSETRRSTFGRRDARPGADRWYGLSLVAFVLAALSKGSVVILPALLLGIVRWLRPLTKRDLLRIAPFVLVGAGFLATNVWFQARLAKDIPGEGLVERLLTGGAVVWFYLYKALLPVNLMFFYPRWHVSATQLWWWLPLLAVVGVTLLLWMNRHRWGRPLLFAWGYFCVSLAPVLGLTDVAFMEHSLVADHYQHVALIAVVTLVAAGWALWRQPMRGPARRAADLAAVAVTATLAFLTWQQSKLYVDGAALYTDTLEKNPSSWLAHNNLGVTLAHAGRSPAAIVEYESALRLNPDFFEAHYNLGLALTKTGRPQEALTHFEHALGKNPDYADAHYNMGLALAAAEQPEAALGRFRNALRLRPEYAEAHNDLGVTLVKTAQLQEAIGHFEQALRLQPDLPDAQYNLEVARAMQQAEISLHPAGSTEQSSGSAGSRR